MNASISSIKQSQIEQKWYVADIAGKRVGHAASIVAQILLGKNNPKVRPYHNPDVKVIVLNTDKIDFTNKRGFSKFFKRYSGFPGGLRFTSLNQQMKKDSTKVFEHAIRGMLPKNKRGRSILAKNLIIYPDEEHPHEAQKPEVIDLSNFKV